MAGAKSDAILADIAENSPDKALAFVARAIAAKGLVFEVRAVRNGVVTLIPCTTVTSSATSPRRPESTPGRRTRESTVSKTCSGGSCTGALRGRIGTPWSHAAVRSVTTALSGTT